MSRFPGVGLVIGAASGIGHAVAVGLAQAGCTRLILADLASSDKLAAVVDACRVATPAAGTAEIQILPVSCDVRDPESIDQMVEDSVRKFGAIHYCANCAGVVVPPRRSTESSLAEFTEAARINQKGTWLCMRAEIRQILKQKANVSQLEGGASIVNVSSSMGFAAEPGFAGYAAASHGIDGMTRSTAMDYLNHDIRINCVNPGPTDTPGLDASGARADHIKNVPRQSVRTAREVAAAAIFLLSHDASGIVGVSLPVDGGWSLCHS